MVLSPAAVFAGTNRFTAEILSKSEPSTNLTRVVWHPSGREVTYLRPRRNAKTTNTVLWAYDVASGKERVLFDPATTSGSTNQRPLSLSAYQWAPSGDAILVTSANDLWVIPLVSGQPRQLTHDAAAEELPTFSPDGK
ncbi:MAG TPA: hypothetical protein VEO53_12620, partial [Candidatus Binatia bacterium]|nr:hypothetical protein [Candidatus Binatia bacterium]